jgi:hypothetical protein
VRAARDEALVRLDVEEEHQVAEVRGAAAVGESGVLSGKHRREHAERERRVLVRDLQSLGQRLGAHAPVGRRGSDLPLELREGLRQRALREDELGDGQEAVLERLTPRTEECEGRRRRGRRRLRWRSSRRVKGLLCHQAATRERRGGGGDLGVRWKWRLAQRECGSVRVRLSPGRAVWAFRARPDQTRHGPAPHVRDRGACRAGPPRRPRTHWAARNAPWRSV